MLISITYAKERIIPVKDNGADGIDYYLGPALFTISIKTTYDVCSDEYPFHYDGTGAYYIKVRRVRKKRMPYNKVTSKSLMLMTYLDKQDIGNNTFGYTYDAWDNHITFYLNIGYTTKIKNASLHIRSKKRVSKYSIVGVVFKPASGKYTLVLFSPTLFLHSIL